MTYNNTAVESSFAILRYAVSIYLSGGPRHKTILSSLRHFH